MSVCNNDCRKHLCTVNSLELMSATTDSAVAAVKAPELQLDRQLYLNLHFAFNEEDDEYCEDDDCYDEDIEHDLAHLPEDGLPVIEKRKTARKVEPVDSTVPKKACPELPWHPMFNQDIPRIILLSNDNQRLCVNKDILTSYRSVQYSLSSISVLSYSRRQKADGSALCLRTCSRSQQTLSRQNTSSQYSSTREPMYSRWC